MNLKKEYCKLNGYTKFNKYNENNYTKFLEKKITELNQALQLQQTGVSISLVRAKKYARHQHFLGTQGKELVEFEYWKQD